MATPTITATHQGIADATKSSKLPVSLSADPRSEGLPFLGETHGIKLNGFTGAGGASATFSLPNAGQGK